MRRARIILAAFNLELLEYEATRGRTLADNGSHLRREALQTPLRLGLTLEPIATIVSQTVCRVRLVLLLERTPKLAGAMPMLGRT